jgi:hypothetical protein
VLSRVLLHMIEPSLPVDLTVHTTIDNSYIEEELTMTLTEQYGERLAPRSFTVETR